MLYLFLKRPYLFSKPSLRPLLLATMAWSLRFTIVLFSIQAFSLESDRERPMEYDADSCEYNNGVLRCWGNVNIKQGSLNVRAEELIATGTGGSINYVHAKGTPLSFEQLVEIEGGPNALEKMEANSRELTYHAQKGSFHLSGSAHIKKGDTELNSDNIYYHLKDKQIEAVGNARSQQRGSRLSSHRIVYNITTGRVKAEKSDKQRIRVVLPPQKSN